VFGIALLSVLLVFGGCDKGRTETSKITDSTSEQNAGTSRLDFTFNPIIEFHGEAFPVKILALSAKNTAWDGSSRMSNSSDYIGDVFGDFGVSLTISSSQTGDMPVLVEIEGDRLIRKSTLEATIPQGKQMELFPRMVYDYSALEQLTQPATETFFSGSMCRIIRCKKKWKLSGFTA
jgi:hypothetical protein